MSSKPFKALSEKDFMGQATSKCPVIAIDMGYSSNKKSCGICGTSFTAGNFYFGDAVERVKTFISENPYTILIIEAPLSVSHKKSGNPQIRGTFEKGHEWWWKAGAVTHLGAQRFLQQLLSDPPVPSKPIRLAEAYLPQNTSVQGHDKVAQCIVKHFFDKKPMLIYPEAEPILPEKVNGVPPIKVFRF